VRGTGWDPGKAVGLFVVFVFIKIPSVLYSLSCCRFLG
jgi:hypothetical protein